MSESSGSNRVQHVTGPSPWLVFVATPLLAFAASYGGVQSTLAETRVEVRHMQQAIAQADARMQQRVRESNEARIRLEAQLRANDLAVASMQQQIVGVRELIEQTDRRNAERDHQILGVVRELQSRLLSPGSPLLSGPAMR